MPFTIGRSVPVRARYVGAIERAAVSASVTDLGRLAEALGVDPCALIRPLLARNHPRRSRSPDGSRTKESPAD